MVGPSRCCRRSRSRDAFTLIEILLVVGLIIIITGLALPSFFGGWRAQQLRSAADQLRADLAQARNRAMTSGQTLGLIYTETNYTVGPAGELIDENEGNISTPMYQQLQDLPQGIKLAGLSSQGAPRDQAANPGGESAGATSSPGSGEVFAYFYPDGTTSTVEFELSNDKKERLIVSLRGITGVALVQNAPSQNEGIIVAEIPAAQGGTP